ncbi:MAG: phosphoglycerate kinase [Candidatus Omnitrophica bacterium]|nr:phosphoglycerate kinase [Candidatus Omnitrophota bacterium]
MNKQTVRDVNLKDKKVIVRVDFNVPLDGATITDDIRIRSAVPTIKYIIDAGASKIILMSHLGRPKGVGFEKEFSLAPAAKRLAELLGQPVKLMADCVGPEVKTGIASSTEKVILLENLRFHKEEEKNDLSFAKDLASLADIYVNDAFGTAHRAHASTAGIAAYLPAVSGFLIEKELKYLGAAINNPERPFVVILGGAKVSDKILLIESLLKKANTIIIGGGMAYTFLKAQGISIGNSKLEKDKIDLAKGLLEKAKAVGVRIELTEDFVIVPSFDSNDGKIVDVIPDGFESLDIGPKTRAKFKKVLETARTVVWNGPLGVFERDAFANGTKEIAQYLAALTDQGVKTIIGGGDSAAAVAKFGLEDKMTHISTGGGASLEYLEGKELPGITALNDKKAASGCGCSCSCK